jgi:RNA recognition motif-containing protein
MTKLFAVGFPRELDELQLAQMFGPYGDIELLTIMRDQVTGRSKGFGFIHMRTESGAMNAIEALNGKPFGDRQMEVRLAEDKEAVQSRPVYQPVKKHKAATPEKKKRPRLNK